MLPSRIQVKYYVESLKSVDLSAFIGVFQRWIQQKALEGLLIDVADYRHVYEGPGIVLIGHESDYALESRDGRLGLLYTRKRQPEDASLQSALRHSLRLALTACRLIENDPALRIKFRTDEAEIRLVDRLRFPNRPETFEAVKDGFQTVLGDVYGSGVSFTHASKDRRNLFTIAIRAENPAGVAELLNHLQPENTLL